MNTSAQSVDTAALERRSVTRRHGLERSLLPWKQPRPAARMLAAKAAFGKRQPFRTLLARGISRSLRGLRRLAALPSSRSARPTEFRIVPAPGSAEELADVIGRFNWYLGDLGVNVRIAGESNSVEAPAEDAPYLDPELVRSPATLVEDHAGPAHLLVHRVTPSVLPQMFRARGRVSVVDSRLHFLDDSFAFFYLRRLLTGGSPKPHVALDRLFALQAAEGGTALVVGTGPSARDVLNRTVDHDVRIVCNSAVRDHKLLEHVRPNVIAFSDHVFHFGPSRYAAAFRDDLKRLARETDGLLVAPEFGAELLVAHCPELAERTVALIIEPGSPTWRAVSPLDTSVMVTGNVLTQFMMPVAFALATTIDIAGCDGRKPGESYFWSHGKSVQYDDDLMRTVFEAHIPFFRDNDYGDYYERHCAQVASFVAWAEHQGKTVRSVTHSYIPAFAARGVAQ